MSEVWYSPKRNELVLIYEDAFGCGVTTRIQWKNLSALKLINKGPEYYGLIYIDEL